MTNYTAYKIDEIVRKYCFGKKPTFSSTEFKFWKNEELIVIEIGKSISDNHLISKRKIFYDYDINGEHQLEIHKIRGNHFTIFCGLRGKNKFYNLGKGFLERHPHKPTEIKLKAKIQAKIWKEIGWTIEELKALKFNDYSLPIDLIEIIIEDKFLKFEETKGFDQQFPIGFKEIDDSTKDIFRLYNDTELKEVFGLASSRQKGKEIPMNLLDVNKMICIGDVDFEVLVCLDMRDTKENPSIIALSWKTEKEKWEHIASNIGEFEKKVSIDGLNYFMKKRRK